MKTKKKVEQEKVSKKSIPGVFASNDSSKLQEFEMAWNSSILKLKQFKFQNQEEAVSELVKEILNVLGGSADSNSNLSNYLKDLCTIDPEIMETIRKELL